uniref:P0 protein n=1 Tax=Rice drawf polerovirus TaxID=3229777 RepID=A0AAU8EIG0_9VIRU
MLQTLESGQLVVSHELVAEISTTAAVYVLSLLPDFFQISLLTHHYGVPQLRNFLASCFHLAPLLVSGKARSIGGSRLLFRRREASHLLRWGLATGYTPRLELHKRSAILHLREMSGTYREQLLRVESSALSKSLCANPRALLRGSWYFRACMELNLRELENDVPSCVGNISLADRLLLGVHIAGGVVNYLDAFGATLCSGRLSGVARYYNCAYLPGVQVDFWDWANISIHSQPEVYFQDSHIQKILR